MRRFPKLLNIVDRIRLPDTQVITRRIKKYVPGSYAKANYKTAYDSPDCLHFQPDLFKNPVYPSAMSEYRQYVNAKMKKERATLREKLLHYTEPPPLSLTEKGTASSNARKVKKIETAKRPVFRMVNAVEARDQIASEKHEPRFENDYSSTHRAKLADMEAHKRKMIGSTAFYGPSPELAKNQISEPRFLNAFDMEYKNEQLEFMHTREMQQESMYRTQEESYSNGKNTNHLLSFIADDEEELQDGGDHVWVPYQSGKSGGNAGGKGKKKKRAAAAREREEEAAKPYSSVEFDELSKQLESMPILSVAQPMKQTGSENRISDVHIFGGEEADYRHDDEDDYLQDSFDLEEQ